MLASVVYTVGALVRTQKTRLETTEKGYRHENDLQNLYTRGPAVGRSGTRRGKSRADHRLGQRGWYVLPGRRADGQILLERHARHQAPYEGR